jgi:hypothetical protein
MAAMSALNRNGWRIRNGGISFTCRMPTMRLRRLVRGYETTKTSAETWIYIAMTRI